MSTPVPSTPSSTTALLGSVAELRRYPVKSMLGAVVDSLEIASGGVDHDRILALIDEETGRIGSAKQPRLWRDLLQCIATWSDDAVHIAMPDGRNIAADDPRVDALLSEVLGRPVRLIDTRPEEAFIARPDPEDVIEQGEEADVAYRLVTIGGHTPGGTFVDDAPVSLVTTSTLQRVGFEALRYRPNIVIETDASVPAFVENDWTGRDLHVGDVHLRGMKPIVRCAIPTLEHGELPRAVDAVRNLLTMNRIARPDGSVGPCLGAYAEVVSGGSVRPGDPVTVG